MSAGMFTGKHSPCSRSRRAAVKTQSGARIHHGGMRLQALVPVRHELHGGFEVLSERAADRQGQHSDPEGHSSPAGDYLCQQAQHVHCMVLFYRQKAFAYV